MVARTFEEFDANKDNKLQPDELALMPEERRGRMPTDADANSDGAIDRVEMTAAITKLFQQRRPRQRGSQRRRTVVKTWQASSLGDC